jgi:50S ribosomal subunit-associated GTPase HflX
MRTDGLAQLKTRLRQLAQAGRVTVRVRVPHADGAVLAELYRAGEVVSREQTDGAYELVVRVEPWQAEEWQRKGLVTGPLPLPPTAPAPEAASDSFRRISGASS